MNLPEIQNSEVIIFKPKSEQAEFQVVLDGEHDTVWATEQQIMDLFGKARRTIGEHIKNIYEKEELDKESTWREFRQVQKEGEREVFRFVWFLEQNKHHLNETGERRISDNTLVALAVAQSLPEQRETIKS